MDENMDGYCRFGEKIAIREGMSEIQTISAIIHELAYPNQQEIPTIRLYATNGRDSINNGLDFILIF